MNELPESPNEPSFELQLKEIEAQQFLVPKDKLGYAEEFITIQRNGLDKNMLLNYSLSNSLEEIEMAIFNRTGHEIKLENAKWELNPKLSVSVKHLMNKHKVMYSMTAYYSGTTRIAINMRAGDYWFFTSYGEVEGKCYSWDHYETIEEIKRMLKEIRDSYKTEDED